MVELDLNVNQVVHMYNSEQLDEEKAKKTLLEFSKDDLVEFILNDEEEDADDDDDEQYNDADEIDPEDIKE